MYLKSAAEMVAELVQIERAFCIEHHEDGSMTCAICCSSSNSHASDDSYLLQRSPILTPLGSSSGASESECSSYAQTTFPDQRPDTSTQPSSVLYSGPPDQAEPGNDIDLLQWNDVDLPHPNYVDLHHLNEFSVFPTFAETALARDPLPALYRLRRRSSSFLLNDDGRLVDESPWSALTAGQLSISSRRPLTHSQGISLCLLLELTNTDLRPIFDQFQQVRPESAMRHEMLTITLDSQIQTVSASTAVATLSIGYGHHRLRCYTVHTVTLRGEDPEQTPQYTIQDGVAARQVRRAPSALVYGGSLREMNDRCNEWVDELVDEKRFPAFCSWAFQDTQLQAQIAQLVALYEPVDGFPSGLLRLAREYLVKAYIMSRALNLVPEDRDHDTGARGTGTDTPTTEASPHLLTTQLKAVLALQMDFLEQRIFGQFPQLIEPPKPQHWTTALCILITMALALEVQQSLRQLAAHGAGDPDLLGKADQACKDSTAAFRRLSVAFVRCYGKTESADQGFNPLTGPTADQHRSELDQPSQHLVDELRKLMYNKGEWPDLKKEIEEPMHYPCQNVLRLVSTLLENL